MKDSIGNRQGNEFGKHYPFHKLSSQQCRYIRGRGTDRLSDSDFLLSPLCCVSSQSKNSETGYRYCEHRKHPYQSSDFFLVPVKPVEVIIEKEIIERDSREQTCPGVFHGRYRLLDIFGRQSECEKSVQVRSYIYDHGPDLLLQSEKMKVLHNADNLSLFPAITRPEDFPERIRRISPAELVHRRFIDYEG